MKHFWSALASYGRVLGTVSLTLMVNMGHIPANGGEWKQIAVGSLFAFIPVILRALNPEDKTFGVGATK